MKKRRKKTVKQRAEIRLWNLCKEYIRRRDKMICQKCEKEIFNPQGADTSHVFCKNRYKSLKYDEFNLKVLCMYCHKWFHNCPIESAAWFKQKFPDRYDYLFEKKKQIEKVTIVQIEELIEYYQDLLVGLDMNEN